MDPRYQDSDCPAPEILIDFTHGRLPVEARTVQVSFDGQPVLLGVTFSVPHGQVVALIGPNGSGKTTLLRCLLGLQKISSGEIRLFVNGRGEG